MSHILLKDLLLNNVYTSRWFVHTSLHFHYTPNTMFTKQSQMVLYNIKLNIYTF